MARLQDVYILKTSSRRIPDVFKTSSRRLGKRKILRLGRQEIMTLKTFSRHLQDMS